jgi:hypothetical protein
VENLDCEVMLDLQDQQVKKVMPGHRVFLERKVKPDSKATSDLRGRKAKKVILVLLVPRD